MYVRLGYEFNIACRAFTAIGVETADLGPVPDLLRGILEDTLSQDASPASLDRYLPKIRDIIINLLHGLKRKQQRLRTRQAKENPAGPSGHTARQPSGGSTGTFEGSLISQTLEDVPSRSLTGRRNLSEDATYGGEIAGPPRAASLQNGASSPVREDMRAPPAEPDNRSYPREATNKLPTSNSDSSLSSNAMQELPVVGPEDHRAPPQRMSVQTGGASFLSPPPPPPPPKQNDALAELQKGGELERRASRRFSTYQLQKTLGAASTGMPMLPPAQNSPIPNRGRDVRESLNAVRTRGSLVPGRQPSMRTVGEPSPTRKNQVSRISEESFHSEHRSQQPSEEQQQGSPIVKTPEDKLGRSYIDADGNEKPVVSATLNGPPPDELDRHQLYDDEEAEPQKTPATNLRRRETRKHRPESHQSLPPVVPAQEFVPETSPQPGKELTLFLQYKTKIKKFVLPDGSDLSIARLQLAFIEKFAWNTHNNGNDLPQIYIQDPVSGVRHELEDLSDVKERSVLVLNVEVLDEVKKHMDEGLGGIRRMIEGVRTVVDGQQTYIQQLAERQQDAGKEIARLASAPTPSTRATLSTSTPVNGIRYSGGGAAAHITGIHSLRRDLAVVRQSFSNFQSDIASSMGAIKAKAATVKTVAIKTKAPTIEDGGGRSYVEEGKRALGDESESMINRVDDLQDLVEDLRKDVVTRGVRPLPRQLETVSRDISSATAGLKKMQEYLRREKPIWTKIWEKELELVCNDREFLTVQEELVADLEDDLEKATHTFALVEEATKQQNLQADKGQPGAIVLRSTSRGMSVAADIDVDPVKAKDGVLGEIRALQPSHETRLEAIERAEKARQKELQERQEGEFKKELGSFVDEGKLKKSGGVEEAERLRKAKDEKLRREGWEFQQAMNAKKAAREAEERVAAAAAAAESSTSPVIANGGGSPVESHPDAAGPGPGPGPGEQ